jgi:hypothetical protein
LWNRARICLATASFWRKPTAFVFGLVNAPGACPGRRVLPRRTLMADVWGIDEPMNSRTVDVHIRRLRDKLGPDQPRITTVRGIGYRFDGGHDVVIEPAPEWTVV